MADRSTPRSTPARPAVDRLDLCLALLLGLLAGGLAQATQRPFLIGDGPELVSSLTLRETVWWHAAYLPAGRLIKAVSGMPPFFALQWLGILSSAVAGGATFLAARLMPLGRVAALAAAGVFVLSPSMWFQPTIVEVHGLHGAHVAMVLGIVLWRRGRRGAALAGVLCIASLILTHRTAPLIAPTIALLAVWPGRSWRGWLRSAVLAALGLGLGTLLDVLIHRVYGGPGISAQFLVASSVGAQTLNPSLLSAELLAPAGLLLLGLFGCAALPPRLRVPLLIGVACYVLAVASVDVRTDGGYIVPGLALLALPVGRLVERSGRLAPGVALLLIAAQAGWARSQLWSEERVALDRAAGERVAALTTLLPERALLLSAMSRASSIGGRTDHWDEVHLGEMIRDTLNQQVPDEAFALAVRQQALQWAGLAAARDQKVFWSREWPGQVRAGSALASRLELLETVLSGTFEIEPTESSGIALWRLGRPD